MRLAWCWRKRGVRREEHEGEFSAALALLDHLPLRERLVTGDALYCQREFCERVLAAGGQYLVTVKENQPTLYAAIAELFASPPPGEQLTTAVQRDPPWTSATTRDRGHGRQEERTLTASAALAGYLDWPGVAQVFRLERRRVQVKTGVVRAETVYGLTDLSPTQASAAQLLAYVRGHWLIEIV